MRLLNVRTLQLEDYVGSDIPRCSILSHRWEDEEVTFLDLVGGHYSEMKGYRKVRNCCRISKNEGLKYTWIDSCCIDKSSSAELSEAINSMFRWYRNAAACYAYLSDAASRTTTKVEDKAYCLMGLFDVNMPLIYGEGKKAFQRLQGGIMNHSDDDSIFAWSHYQEEYTGSISGILADSPRCFSIMNEIDCDSELGAGSSNMFKILENYVKLQLSNMGTVRSFLHDPIDSLSLICRVSDSSGSLISTVREEYPEDHTVLDATIGVLQCRAKLGRVVLLLHEHGTGLYSRYHFDGHLYFVQDSVEVRPPEILKILLYQRQDHDDPYMPIPAIRLDARVARLGYRLWATSTASTPDAEHKGACWLRARRGSGYLLFENRRSPEWPPFMLIYRYEPEDNHFKVYCGLVPEDFMPDDAVEASHEVEFQSSCELSELRVQVAENKHLVIKVRVKSNYCDIILLLQ
ncbi:hypothetical protein FHL15_005765 [Xylaria flabelliformis]|uniref:Heterokaryon incompatibility domain-containing protein n=1 Tax=Xylaria flabelliformis TaxID=2512241 RepID=A0A553HZV8_9PEZI|nr:hypothetical protein FHL15_005765 [Xylaria flabelliformis]